MKKATVRKIGFLFFVKSGENYIICKESREEAEIYAAKWNRAHGYTN